MKKKAFEMLQECLDQHTARYPGIRTEIQLHMYDISRVLKKPDSQAQIFCEQEQFTDTKLSLPRIPLFIWNLGIPQRYRSMQVCYAEWGWRPAPPRAVLKGPVFCFG